MSYEYCVDVEALILHARIKNALFFRILIPPTKMASTLTDDNYISQHIIVCIM